MLKSLKYLVLFYLFFHAFLTNAWYNYPYVCDTINCNRTEFKEINKDDNWYFLSNEKFLNISNFKNHIDNKLLEYSDYYGSSKITIYWYYSWSWNITNKQFTFWELIEQKKFHIAELKWLPWFRYVQINDTYEDWKDYIFSNFRNVIDTFHSGFPSWDKRNYLSYILANINYYDDSANKFALRNICETDNCYKSNYLLASYDLENKFKFLSWDIKRNSDFIFENFKVSEDFYISKVFLKAWGSINFNFKFEDYLDASKATTKYNYRIFYKYAWETLKEFLNETIYVSKDYVVSSPNIWNDVINNIIDLDVLRNDTKKIRVWVKEWLSLTKVWNITFYFSVENVTTWEKFDASIINYSPVVVIPDDKVENWEADITSPFTKALNTTWFNVWDTFWVVLKLEDKFQNGHYDYIDWYDVSLESWTSEFLELAKIWSNTYSKTLTWLKTTQTKPYYVEFKFRITKSWFHVFNWFNVKVKSKNNNSSYITPYVYYELKWLIPKQLYDWNQKMNIYIKSPAISDFTIVCSKWPIVLKTTCTSDNFSWCNPAQNKQITFNSESQNWSVWSLTIIDYAYNVKSYQYNMNHIDKTAPTIAFKKWSSVLNWNLYNFQASDEFFIDVSEKTTTNCIDNSNTNYLLKINWTTVLNKNTKDLSFSVDLWEYLKYSWKKVVYFKVTDVYWNSSEKEITFNIFPTTEDFILSNQSTLDILWVWEKYADNVSNYEYTLVLKDKFWNPVYNKNISFIDQNCDGFSQCKTIKTNMLSNTWNDALIEYDYSEKTDLTWKITFKLKSLTPWEFNQRFKITLKSWWDDYVNLTSDINFYKNISTNNTFKKPFKWELVSSKDGENYNSLPEIWTDLYYKLLVKWITTVNGLTIELDDFKTFIKPVDEQNTTIQNLSDISGLTTKNPKFTWRINTSLTATSLWEPWIKISNISNQTPIIISYILWGENVKYYLSADDLATSREVIKLENSKDSFLWVKVIWSLQWWWKSELTWQQSNISDLSVSSLRSSIRKNAFDYVKNMKNNQILNKVKYVVWDVTISWDLPYETLIVKDGNIIISWDLNLQDKKLWLVVLKDRYVVSSDYSWKWNVYINPNVKRINAIIYADGWVISSDSSSNPYLTDSATRTSQLNNQLYIKGTLFTRNTIGWAMLAWWSYILPWWSKTSNFDIAMIYDLNFTRRWNFGCDKNWNWNCYDTKEYKEPLVIEYDSRIQSDPPKIFKN